MRKLFRLRPEFTLDDLRRFGRPFYHVSRRIGIVVDIGYFEAEVRFPDYDGVVTVANNLLEEVTRVTLPSGETARIIGTEGDRVTVAPEWAIKTFSLEEVK